jgi:hypothetical protein
MSDSSPDQLGSMGLQSVFTILPLAEGAPTIGVTIIRIFMMRHCQHILIICEQRGDWAVALRRWLADAPLVVRETRSLDECREEVARCGNSSVVVELMPANLDRLMDLLQEFASRASPLDPLVVAPRAMREYEWLVREAGAAAFITQLRHAPLLAGVVRRRIARQPALELPLLERIEASLPWPDRATQRSRLNALQV